MSKFSKKLISPIEPVANASGIYSAVEQLQNLNALAITAVNFCADSSGTDGGLGDDTAVNTAGGFVKLTGSGFTSASIVYINGTSVTKYYLNNTTIVAVVPAAVAGTVASLMVFNGSTVGSIWAAGISYSGFPSWTTTAATNPGLVVSTQLVAVGDAPLVYTFVSGTLPPNCTISSSGLLSGTVTGVSTNTIYTFTVAVTDAQNQNVSQSIVYTLVVSDAFYRYTSLHISGDSNPTWITDASTNVLAVTPAGAPQSTIFSPLKAGYYGNSFNGSSDYLTTPSVAGLAMGTGDFTIELWYYPQSGDKGIFQISTTSGGFFAGNTNTIALFIGSVNNLGVYASGTTTYGGNNKLPYNAWTHIALVRISGVTKAYINGILDTSFASGGLADTTNYTGTYAVIGGYYSTTYLSNGYISNFRVVKGTAVYTANFTPSATPLTAITNTSLLTCQSARFIDKSAIDTTYTVTNSGASAYTINGSSNPTLNLVRGFTYYFNVNASGHPFWIKTTNVTGTSSAYSSGVTNNGVDYGTVTFTVPLDAPSTLYYICQIHSSMVGSFAISDGIAITATGTPKVVSSNPFNLPSGLSAYGAGYFDGTGDYLTTPSNSVFTVGTGDFTIEGWYYLTGIASDTRYLFDCRSGGQTQAAPTLFITGGAYTYYVNGAVAASGGTPVANQWVHVALVRYSSVDKLYINGTSVFTLSGDTGNYTSSNLRIGSEWSASGLYDWNGYISNFRFVKGTAIYTAAFTPPTAPLTAITNTSLLTLQTNVPHNNSQFRDTSTNNALITRGGNTTQGSFSPFTKQYPYSTATVGGSAYFDGTGDHLTVPFTAGGPLDFGAGNFTIEYWINTTVNGNTTGIGYFNSGQDYGYAWILTVDTSNIRMQIASAAVTTSLDYSTSGVTITDGTWHHIALVRSGNTFTTYVDGIARGTGSSSITLYAPSQPLRIGMSNTYPGYFTGYVSNYRIVKGTAVYTSNFTPSTTPLTAVSGTVLLMPFTNAAVYDNTMLSNLETVGNVQVNTSVFKYGTGALKFNGSTDYLTVPASANTSFGTGDFTVEFWINTAGANSQILSLAGGTAAGNWQVSLYNGNFYWQSARNTTDALYVASASITNSLWHHVVISRASNTLRIFFDGTQQGSVTDSTNYNVTSVLNIGYSTTYFNGYIDELRITKGYARYTAAFTPSTGAFSASAPFGTSVLPSKSLRFRASASAYLSRTPAVAGNQKTWTWSGWVKRGTLGVYAALFAQGTGSYGGGYGFIRFDSNDTLSFTASADGNTASATWASTPVYRDPAAWYHVVAVLDTTQATSSNRFKLYVNGVLQSGTFSTAPGQNADIQLNRAALHQIGVTYANGFGNYLDGELAEVNFVDGLALDPTMFGAYSAYNQWLPVSYSGYMGANGFYLPFNATTTASANYLLVGGGGGGGQVPGGGGGGGGFRTGSSVTLDPTSVYAISVGAGGAGSTATWPSAVNAASPGGGSTFNSITAAGGGRGGADGSVQAAGSGGSGGGASGGYQNFNVAGGAGNTPSTSPSQGNSGGNSSVTYVAGTVAGAGGGGGAGGVGSPGSVIVTTTYAYGTGASGDGGAGAVSSISGTSVTYAGGGGGGGASATAAQQGNPAYRYLITAGAGGTGGGAAGTTENVLPVAATANLGGGGGGSGFTTGYYGPGGAGGSGVVIISYSGVQKFYGGNVTSVGGNTIHTFTTSGSLTGVFGDQSGNNNWTPNNINVSTVGPTYDLLTDVPTLTSATAANYAVLNPLQIGGVVTSPTPIALSNGNLSWSYNRTTSGSGWLQATIAIPSTGKWYYEYVSDSGSPVAYSEPGIMDIATPKSQATPSQYRAYYGYDGTKLSNGVYSAYGTTAALNDVLSVAIDMDNGALYFGKNGTYLNSGVPTSGASKTGAAFTDLISAGVTWVPMMGIMGNNTASGYVNFGQRPFAYTPPANFLALNTYNI